MNNVINYLKRPFPQVTKTTHKLIASILFGVFVYVFLIVFQPFEVNLIKDSIPLYLSGFGLITFIYLLVGFFIFPLIFSSFFNPDKWTIGKNIVYIIITLMAIAISNWGYNLYFQDSSSSQHGLLRFIFITTSVGIFPILILLYFIENHLDKANRSIAKSVNTQIQNLSTKDNQIPKLLLTSENKNEDIEIELAQLICIKSEGNYALVSYKTEDQITKKMIRNTISNLEKSLKQYESIYRCHRSYLVNLQNVSQVTGNARNFNLSVTDLGFNIPVSRSFPKSILNSIS